MLPQLVMLSNVSFLLASPVSLVAGNVTGDIDHFLLQTIELVAEVLADTYAVTKANLQMFDSLLELLVLLVRSFLSSFLEETKPR